MSKSRIKIQDTTLRDGEQTPGIAFNLNEKLKVFNVLSAYYSGLHSFTQMLEYFKLCFLY